MLKLLIFAPCEKVIVGQDKLASIISVMQYVTVAALEGMPADALAPVTWSAFVMWRRVGNIDGEVTYRAKIEMFRPDGVSVFANEYSIEVSNNQDSIRNIIALNILPVGMVGDVLLKLFLRKDDEGIEWQEVAEYPIQIKRTSLVEQNEKRVTENARS